METPKEQAIKAAYGEYYKDYRRFIDENGFIYQSDLFFPETGMKKDGVEAEIISVEKKHKWSNIKWRPMSLQGLENNRGWTRIESEEDLPKDDYFGNLFEVGFLDESGFFHHDKKRCSFKSLKWMYEKKLITHYQLVEKPKPPIF
ncbi:MULTISPECIES: hypothetical protein [Elizabethkingia]|uniref:hypothetical protein n=1 Tax=Elizabethkingia TaxID=308865 RepID=UPI0021A88C51|nr:MULTISPECIES: hypothetical protein [Elizabethkingia]MCT3689547.1 hypothetical protein [Elizabethkingia anophelis]MCT3706364.1 hypothetical protein [Elizabethkingia anophelis]MCT3713383.1 hypothetical protein [Elizabethkingia anophelis]MCT3716801.1 hypothetical protein [Elizabethkingia anophelis]MCT3730440.1 hypothetical protein [Elizabethkingia anophelis]